MALVLQFPQEGEFSSRAIDFDDEPEQEIASAQAIFRWRRSVRELLKARGSGAMQVDKLVVAMQGRPQEFVQQLASEWEPIGTLVLTDQPIVPCKLDAMASAGCVILSKYSIDHEDFGKTLIALAVQEVSEQSVWLWTCSLLQHIEPQEIVCLETQASPIYENAYGYEAYPFLRMLATSSVAEEVEMEVPVHILETPRFLNGVPAALLTHGELKKKPVRAYVCVQDFTTHPSEVLQCFLPLVSVVGLDRPLFFRPQSAGQAFNPLYS